MQRVQLTLAFDGLEVPETFERATAHDDVSVDVLNWNAASRPAAFLLRVYGDSDAFEAMVEADPVVQAYELAPETESASLCYLVGEASAGTQAMFAHFSAGSLLSVPPVQWCDDGTCSFALFGTRADVQTAVDEAPAGVSVTVEAVGGDRLAPDAVRQRLSSRQREAVEAALELGYYEEPRSATTEDLGRALDCAPSTAATHLRKAESRLLRALFDDPL